MWQVVFVNVLLRVGLLTLIVFANVFIEGRAVDSDVNGFFDGSGHTMSLPSYNFEVFH